VNPAGQAVRLILPRKLWGNFLVTGLAFASFGTVYTYLPLNLLRDHDFSQATLTWFMMAFGLAGLSGTLLSGRLGDAWGNLRIIRWAIAAEIAVLLALRAPVAPVALWSMLLVYSTVSSYIPSLKSLISQTGAKGLALSWNNSAMYLGLSGGASLGALFWPSGMPAVYLASALLLTAGLFSALLFLQP
jgi:predicted MFS family arabinose efflux permease